MEKSGQVKDATTDVASSDMATFDIDNGHLSSKGADEALMYVDAHATAIDPRAEKRVLRKIDWHVMPWLCSLYFLQVSLSRTMNRYYITHTATVLRQAIVSLSRRMPQTSQY